MRHLSNFITLLALILLQSTAIAKDQNKFANFIFPSDNQITQSQFIQLTAPELNNIQKSLELPSEYCLDHIKMRIKDNMLEEWLWGFKKFDFSGDGIDDLLFISYCGGEEYRNYFWVNKDSRYFYSGMMEGTLVKLYRTPDSKAFSVVTRSGYCCAGYIGSIDLFIPGIEDGKLKYKLHKRIKEFGNGQITVPDRRMPSKYFIVKNDKYKLREHPFIDDKYDEYHSDFEGKPVYGNTIAEFAQGSKGVAIAENPDDTGRVWWFVIMAEDAKAIYNRFYEDSNASKAGWMSSRFLKVVD